MEKTTIPRFEQPPIRILNNLFEFFSALELVYSFYNLNPQLNAVIEQDTTLKFIFPPMAPEEHLLSSGFLLAFNPAQVSSLKVWSMDSAIHSCEVRWKFLDELSSFTGLRFLFVYGLMNDKDSALAIDLISRSLLSGRLKQLHSLQIQTQTLTTVDAFYRLLTGLVFTTTSSSLKYLQLDTGCTKENHPFHQISQQQQSTLTCLQIYRVGLEFEDLAQLFPAIQNVSSLAINALCGRQGRSLVDLPNLKTLSIQLTRCPDQLFRFDYLEDLKYLLERTVNLVNLTVQIHSRRIQELPHGFRWSHVLSSDHLIRKLRKVQLRMAHWYQEAPADIVERIKLSFSPGISNDEYWKEKWRSVTVEHRSGADVLWGMKRISESFFMIGGEFIIKARV